MAEPLADQIMRKVRQAAELYHRLMLVVASAGTGKTTALQAVRDLTGAPLININLELSLRMLELTERQRALRLPGILREVIGNGQNDLPAPQSKATRQAGMILLDNLEVIFDVGLKQDPLRLLQGLSRNKTVVVAWNGEIRTEGRGLRTEQPAHLDSALNTQSSALYLTYAAPAHPEYRRYPIHDFLVVSPDLPACRPG